MELIHGSPVNMTGRSDREIRAYDQEVPHFLSQSYFSSFEGKLWSREFFYRIFDGWGGANGKGSGKIRG